MGVAGVVALVIGPVAVAVAWNGEKGRADRLAAAVKATRADLVALESEATLLRAQVSNLEADKSILNAKVKGLETEKQDLQGDNNDLTSVNEAIGGVVNQLDQCLTDLKEVGHQLARDPQSVAQDRIRVVAARCAAAQASAAVLKATAPASTHQDA
jgi:chromosome segregation ATPase